MLTRLRVQGFKNLLDLDVRFGPFTCLAGRNAVGKSNLFDAIRFLHLLTQHPIMEAVKLLRETKGRAPEPRSLFTAFGGFRAPEMRFTAEIVIERNVQDDFGVKALAAISTLRYCVAFRLAKEEGFERLELAEEWLQPIKLDEARRSFGFPARKEFKDSVIQGRRVGDFISTLQEKDGGPQIKVHQEGHGGKTVPAPKSSRTVLGGMASSDFPTILAAHREMESWRTLLLEPSAMRAPSFYSDPRFIDPRGANLPAAIERLRRSEASLGQVYAELANRLSALIDDIHELRIKDDERTETLTLEIRGRDGVFHPASSLSDGTLRFLVLATLGLDPEAQGVLCLEEPENGIHPERIPAMVRLLRDIAIDPNHAMGEDNPLRQVMVNTHSPVVVENIGPQDLIYLDEQNVSEDADQGLAAVLRVPGKTWRASAQTDILPLAPGQLQSYLSGTNKGKGQLWLDFIERPARI
ncbi:MAG TPA: AAA family ATPase [Thermoanaerobaculia bacterium]|jgi:predicted ATPase